MDSPHEDDNKARAMNDYLQELPSQHLEPLWSQMNVMVPPTPAPVAKPHIWKYADSLPLLHKAAEMVGEKQAERRVLMLVNPNMGMYSFSSPNPEYWNERLTPRS